MLEAIVDKSITLPQTDPELPAIEQGNANLELTSLLHCSLPTPSSSSGQSHQTRPGKMKRDSNTELLEYLERADERFLQHSKDLNDALLQKLETDTSVFLGHEVVQQTQVKVVRVTGCLVSSSRIWDLSLTARLESGTSTRDCLDCQERL
ncbi:uncharacterized protein LOC144462836 isoform X1 [Epinephelus lanceolatus]